MAEALAKEISPEDADSRKAPGLPIRGSETINLTYYFIKE